MLLSGHRFRTENYEGAFFINNVDGVTFLVFCTSSDHV